MSNFQPRHYQAIAEVVAKLGDPDCRMDISLLLADMFLQDNDRFDTSKFLDACKVHSRPVSRGIVP